MTGRIIERKHPAPIVLERADSAWAALAPRMRPLAPWVVYVTVALCCTAYVNARADLVPKWGQWYAADGQPYILLQVRAFLSGKLALVPHPGGAEIDSFWGRGGMHIAWGLGVSILATPLHLLGRLFGAPGFPDSVRFLIFYALTTVALARALHGLSRKEPGALVASAAAAGFVMVFPTFVGMVSSRFLIYEQTIATGALWSVFLLSGVLTLLHKCTPARLLAVCAAAGFAGVIRAPLAAYGPTTVFLALVIARRNGLRSRWLVAGFGVYVGFASLYFVGNILRFGGPLNSGYETGLSHAFVNRLTRWNLPFAKVPFTVAAKEMFATLFLLQPVGSLIWWPPADMVPYVTKERFREYYAPTFDKVVFAIWVGALVIVCFRVVRGRLWRRDRDLDNEGLTIIGAWALPVSVVLFAFYARMPNWVTRYATDFYPAFAAASLCVGMAIVDAVRRRSPSLAGSAQLALAAAVALYMSGWRGWATHLSTPIDRNEVLSRIASIDANSAQPPIAVPDHYKCGEPRGPKPVISHLDDWRADCTFRSGVPFAMPHQRCVSFTFAPAGADWVTLDQQSLDGFRVTADFDPLVACGAPRIVGETREVTMCDPHPPPFLLDGLRLYAIGTLDADLNPIDRLKLMEFKAVPACP